MPLTYKVALLVMLLSAIGAFVYLSYFVAPYGRHYQNEKKWGMSIPNHVGWVVMECPSVFVFLWVYWQGAYPQALGSLMLMALWQFHYIYRSFVFPFRLQKNNKRMPLLIAASSIIFNTFNASINAYWLSNIGVYAFDTFTILTFSLGIPLFFFGFYIHYRSDGILINLRKPGETGYKIPRGFLFEYVCSPNYLGELLMWTGFAIASMSLAAWLFVLFTLANLLPRSRSHLRWYQEKFHDYPKQRKAMLPFII